MIIQYRMRKVKARSGQYEDVVSVLVFPTNRRGDSRIDRGKDTEDAPSVPERMDLRGLPLEGKVARNVTDEV